MRAQFSCEQFMAKGSLVSRHTRFTVGQHVRIDPAANSPFATLEGIVQSIEPHQRGINALDRYVVRFAWGEDQTFYEVEIRSV